LRNDQIIGYQVLCQELKVCVPEEETIPEEKTVCVREEETLLVTFILTGFLIITEFEDLESS